MRLIRINESVGDEELLGRLTTELDELRLTDDYDNEITDAYYELAGKKVIVSIDVRGHTMSDLSSQATDSDKKFGKFIYKRTYKSAEDALRGVRDLPERIIRQLRKDRTVGQSLSSLGWKR